MTDFDIGQPPEARNIAAAQTASGQAMKKISRSPSEVLAIQAQTKAKTMHTAARKRSAKLIISQPP
ncbi:MAG: hypothetical protein HYS78_00870 [Parcubacteria group bacterium]|nr:hypothetical protein [Parcubacteria group bacterium]